MNKKYTVSTYSGVFRLEKLTSHEMEGYIRESQKPMTDYSKTFDIFNSKKAASTRIKELKETCSVNELPSNNLMVVSWVEAREWEVDEDGELETTTDQWREYYYPGNKCNTVFTRLMSARIAKGISQTELAEAIRTTRQQIGKYERGEQDMTVTRLIQIANALGIHPADLLEKED